MSKTLLVLLSLAIVWMLAWTLAGHFMGEAGVEKLAAADRVATPTTSLEPGADVRVEGTIVDGPAVVAPLGQTPCLAAVTYVSASSVYADAQGKSQRDYASIAVLRTGPAELGIAVGEGRIELPLQRWTPTATRSEMMPELPPRLGISPGQIADAEARLHAGRAGNFAVDEATIDGGARVFVVGRLEDRQGTPRLEADPALGRVVVHHGTQAEFVAQLRGSGGGLRIAGRILMFGLGPLPLMILGLVVLRRALRSTE